MQSRAVMAPLPSMLAGRVSRRTQWSLASCSSAASSMVMMRSSSGMKCDSTLSSVVLPEPVPPETTMFSRDDDARAQELGDLGRHRAEADQVVDAQLLFGELSDGDRRPDQRDRRNDDVHARAIGQAGVADRAGLVDVAAERRHDAVDDAAHVVVVVELDVAQQQPALPLEVDLLRAVDHDLGDGRVLQQRLDGPEADDVGGQLLEQALALGARRAPGSRLR